MILLAETLLMVRKGIEESGRKQLNNQKHLAKGLDSMQQRQLYNEEMTLLWTKFKVYGYIISTKVQ